jgi:hypothetical protein
MGVTSPRGAKKRDGSTPVIITKMAGRDQSAREVGALDRDPKSRLSRSRAGNRRKRDRHDLIDRGGPDVENLRPAARLPT